MREDVALFQDRQEVRLDRPVHHDRQPRGIGDFARRLQHLDVVRQIAVLAVHPDLDAKQAIAIRFDRPDGRPRVDHAGIEIDFVEDDEPDRRDVEQRVDSRGRPVDDVLAETGERTGAARAAIEDRRDAGLEPDDIRIDAERNTVLVDVRMQVDQPGRDQLAPGVEHLAGLVWRDVRVDARDASVGDGDVAFRREVLRRIDDVAAGNQEIVGLLSGRCLRRRRRLRGCCTEAAERGEGDGR